MRVGRGAGRQRLATRRLSIGNVSRRAGSRSRGPGATRHSPRAPRGSALATRVDREDAKATRGRLESRSDTHQHRDGDDGATRHERPQDAPEQRRPVVVLAVVVRGAIGGRSLLGRPAVRGVLAGGAVGARHGGGGGTRAACEVVCRATARDAIAREIAIATSDVEVHSQLSGRTRRHVSTVKCVQALGTTNALKVGGVRLPVLEFRGDPSPSDKSP